MINYNGYNLATLGTINQIKRNILPPNEISTLNIPARPGLLVLMKKHGARVIQVEMTLKGTTQEELVAKAETLGTVLDTMEDVEITFADEPSRTYYGMVQDEIDKDDVTNKLGKVKFSILCANPYKYGPEQTVTVDATNKVAVTNTGTVETFPVIEVTVNNPITFFSAVAPDDYVLIGNPATLDNVQAPGWYRTLTDDLTTLTGWSAGTGGIDGGTVAGAMSLGTKGFKSTNFGAASGWHGPTMQKVLSENLQDFVIRFWVQFDSSAANQSGRAELYLFDAANNNIGKISMVDYLQGFEANFPEVRAGAYGPGKYIMDGSKMSSRSRFNNFYGYIELQRIGKQFKAICMRYDTVKRRVFAGWETKMWDSNNSFQSPLNKVMLHLGQHGTVAVPNMEILKVEVLKVVTASANEVQYIALAGDTLTVDCESGEIFRNGSPAQELYNPATTFISIPPGTTELAFLPEGDVSVELKYKGRWK